ncbi:sodium:dicarboxylate symporter family domain-containing protein [Ditylenchus destructor]|nr:sodium:dicarboxylate symporter family domain-containing protein [Ditylenchus destructor]
MTTTNHPRASLNAGRPHIRRHTSCTVPPFIHNPQAMKKKEDLVLVLTIESVVIGVVLGFMIRPFKPSNDAISLIGFPGEIFMQIVEMMILPLIISSVISALAQIRAPEAGRIGGLTVLYYMTTTFLSTFTGIILVSSIHPGDPTLIHSLGEGTLDDTALSTLDTFLDQIRNMFPENIVQATFQQVQTNYVPVKPRVVPRPSMANTTATPETYVSQVITTGSHVNESAMNMKPILEYTNEVNVLGLIVFCTGFGVILSILGEQARLMINFFIVLDAVIMKWISALMWCYPIGILSLVCKNIVDIDNMTETAQALAMYVVTVICGLMIHSLLTLPLLYYLFTRHSPFNFMTGMLQAIATAFGTASSGATLPVTFKALEGNLKIDRRVTRFVLPLGATISMDGTALYEAVAVIFVAQLHNVQLTLLELLTISVTTTVASIGSGSVPAGLDTILIVLTTVGLPAKDLSLLLTVDWLLDRIRTSVNVLGDGFGCGIIYHLTKERLIESDNDELVQQLKSDIKQLNSELPTVVTPSKEYGFIDQINDESSHPLISIPRANFSASQHRDVPQATTSAGLGRPHRKMSNTSFLSATAAAVKSMNDDERRSFEYPTAIDNVYCASCFVALLEHAIQASSRISPSSAELPGTSSVLTSQAIDLWPSLPEFTNTSQIPLLMLTNTRIQQIRTTCAVRDNYYVLSLADILTSGFYQLACSAQIYQARRTALPAALFLAAYTSRMNGDTEFSLPNKLKPLEIDYPRQNYRAVQGLILLHHRIFRKVLEPLLDMEFSVPELVLLKYLMYCFQGDEEGIPSISDEGKMILNSAGLKLFEVLNNYVVQTYGESNGKIRLQKLAAAASHYRKLVLNDEVKYPLNHLLILNRAPSVTVLNGQLGERVTQKTIDNLTSLLPSANYEQAGDLSATELDPLTRFTEELALTYARIFNEQFHEEKEVRVVPITKLKAYDEDRQHYFKTQDKPYSVVLGVFGRRKGSSEKLKGIAGVLARLNL